MLGERKSNKIAAETIRQAVKTWSEEHKLSPRTIAKVLTTAGRIFRFGIASRFLSHNPVEVLETDKQDSGEQTEEGRRMVDDAEVTGRDVLTPEEAKRLVMASEPGLYRAIITAAIYSGLRHSELLALRWQDVDLEGAVIHVRRTVSNARVKGHDSGERYRWFDPKTKKGIRDVPIGSTLVNALDDWRERCPRSRLDLVFPTEAGEPCHRSNILRYGLYPALDRAKIDKSISMQSLRHTYATMLIAVGRTVATVSGYLGHADVYVTMKVYVHFLKEKRQDRMDDLETLVQNA